MNDTTAAIAAAEVEWVVPCAACSRPLPTLGEQYGPHDAPLCWDCHTADVVPVGVRLSDAARAKIVEELGEAIDAEDEAESYREDADRAEGRAEEIRDRLADEYGLSYEALNQIQDAVDLEEDVDWVAIDGSPPQAIRDAKRDAERLARWQRLAAVEVAS